MVYTNSVDFGSTSNWLLPETRSLVIDAELIAVKLIDPSANSGTVSNNAIRALQCGLVVVIAKPQKPRR